MILVTHSDQQHLDYVKSPMYLTSHLWELAIFQGCTYPVELYCYSNSKQYLHQKLYKSTIKIYILGSILC